MDTTSSLPLLDRDTLMRRVARELAIDIYTLDQILANCDVTMDEFMKWKDNRRFNEYYIEFKQEWHSAKNTMERTKLKAGVVMEEFMEEAYKGLHDRKMPLNHRVELGKLVAKIAGHGEPKFNVPGAGGPGGFSLSINITAGEPVTIQPSAQKTIEHEPVRDGFDDYDPFTSPNTLED